MINIIIQEKKYIYTHIYTQQITKEKPVQEQKNHLKSSMAILLSTSRRRYYNNLLLFSR